MIARLDDRLAALVTMSPAQLRAEWERVYRSPPPRYGAPLLRMGIAYRLQEKALGPLDRRTAAQLGGKQASPSIKPGTRFMRTWNGRTIVVEAQECGFRFEDRPYTSLTSIAREVTGINWSGPRFFGLRAFG